MIYKLWWCSKKRPDVLIRLDTHNIIIEIDENQHYNYEDEDNRIIELYKDLKYNKLVVIRFNPDKYKDNNNNIIKSLFSIELKTKKLKINNQKKYDLRVEKLINEIQNNINIIPENKLNIIKLFL